MGVAAGSTSSHSPIASKVRWVLRDRAVEQVTEYAVPTAERASDYETALAVALLERMHAFCRERGIRLLVLDIPRISGEASMDAAMVSRAAQLGDALIDGSALLSDYAGVAELHVPHGARHISEFTHTMLGVAAARRIAARLETGADAQQPRMSSAADAAAP